MARRRRSFRRRSFRRRSYGGGRRRGGGRGNLIKAYTAAKQYRHWLIGAAVVAVLGFFLKIFNYDPVALNAQVAKLKSPTAPVPPK